MGKTSVNDEIVIENLKKKIKFTKVLDAFI